MGSTPNKVTLPLEQGSSLTTAYGNGSSGWSTEPFDVNGLDQAAVCITVSDWGTEGQIDLAFSLGAESGAMFPSLKIGADGFASREEAKVSKAAIGGLASFVILVDVRAASRLQILGKGNVGDGVMTAELLGEPSQSVSRTLKVGA